MNSLDIMLDLKYYENRRKTERIKENSKEKICDLARKERNKR